MISVDGLTVEFGGKRPFLGCFFLTNEKDRIALMGKNGAGKIYLVEDIGWRAGAKPWKSVRP